MFSTNTQLIEDEWTLVSHGDKWLIVMCVKELIPAPRKGQFVNKVRGRVGGDDANQMMLLSDMILTEESRTRILSNASFC
jgi:hypothetical protein